MVHWNGLQVPESLKSLRASDSPSLLLFFVKCNQRLSVLQDSSLENTDYQIPFLHWRSLQALKVFCCSSNKGSIHELGSQGNVAAVRVHWLQVYISWWSQTHLAPDVFSCLTHPLPVSSFEASCTLEGYLTFLFLCFFFCEREGPVFREPDSLQTLAPSLENICSHY